MHQGRLGEWEVEAGLEAEVKVVRPAQCRCGIASCHDARGIPPATPDCCRPGGPTAGIRCRGTTTLGQRCGHKRRTGTSGPGWGTARRATRGGSGGRDGCCRWRGAALAAANYASWEKRLSFAFQEAPQHQGEARSMNPRQATGPSREQTNMANNTEPEG